jgi:Protein of unknown function (DUF2799)
MRNFLFLLIAAGGLGGCATQIMSEKECLAGDWYGAGLEDGAAGLLDDALDERAARCTKFGVAVDAQAYAGGRDAALARLCTDEGGYGFGRDGGVYRGVCRPDAEPAFLGGYLSGRRIYALALDRNAAQSAYDTAIGQVNYQTSAIDRARHVLDDAEATAEEIEDAKGALDYALRSQGRANRDADDGLYALGRADEALDQAIASAAQWRRSRAFADARQTLAEAHAFARGEPAISHCTDEMGSFRPSCWLRAGAPLHDRDSGVLCVVGPGEARLAHRQRRASGSAHEYAFYAGEAGSGRIARQSVEGFEALFEGDEADSYLGVSCQAATQPY